MAGAGSASGPSSFDDGLNQIYIDIQKLALAPDVPPQAPSFIQALGSSILKARQMFQAAKAQQQAGMAQQQAQQAAMGGGGAQGQPGMPPGGMGQAGGMGAPGGMGQGPQMPGAPNQVGPGGGGAGAMSGYGGVVKDPEQLQRLLAGAGGQQ